METTSQQYGLSIESINGFKLHQILFNAAVPVMRKILIAETQNKRSEETIQEFLIRYIGTNTRIFSRADLDAIRNNTSFEALDFSLLFKLIQLLHRGFAHINDVAWQTPGTFENNLKSLKDIRNELVHSGLMLSTSEFTYKVESVRAHLLAVIREANHKYNTDLHEDEVNNIINATRDNLFSLLNEGRNDLLIHEKTEMLSVSPDSAILDCGTKLRVSDVFMTLEIIKAGRSDVYETIHYTEILRYALENQEKNENPSRKIIILEGVAGSGKSSLLKFLMSDWTSGQHSVSDIGNYNFIIPIHCGLREFTTFEDHLCSVMPSARYGFKNPEQMLKNFLQHPFMILLDGIDEINSESEKLLVDILYHTKNRNCIIVGTTRPHKVKELYERFLHDENAIHLTLKGVPESCAEDFLIKYHKALRDFDVSQEDTEELLNYFRTTRASLNDFWKLPLNLTVLALLWSVAPDRVRLITTAFELLREMQRLAEIKLIERLLNNSRTKHFSLSILRKKVEDFMEALYKEAFSELCCDNVQLQKESDDTLKRLCVELQLPEEEVMGAFLNVEHVSSQAGNLRQLSFPHKSWQEFYSSLHICLKVGDNVTVKDILVEAHVNKEKSLQLSKLQNMLMMLIGVLHQSEKKVKDTLIMEVVNLLAESGVKDRNQWIQILHSVKYDEQVSRQIALLTGIIEGTTRITEEDILAYVTLLRAKRPESVSMEFTSKLSKILNLRELLEVVSEKRYDVDCLSLSDWYGNDNIQDISSLLDVINQVMERCKVIEYRGPLIPKMKFSESIKWLDIRVDDQAAFENLHMLLSQKLIQLESLSVCIPANMDPQDLTPLPGTRAKGNTCEPVYHLFVDLLLLDVRSKEAFLNAADLARKLLPVSGNRMFQRILFPRMEMEATVAMLNASCLRGVRTGTVDFPANLRFGSEQEKERFEDIISEALDCQSVCWNSNLHGEVVI